MMKKSVSFISLLLIILLVFTGCGGKSLNSSYKEDIVYSTNGSSDDFDIDYSYNEEASGSIDKNESIGIVVTNTSDKLVYSCRISLQTKEFSKTISALRELIGEYHGIVQSESQYDNSNNWYYSDYEKQQATLTEDLVIRIPTENYEAFVNGVSGIGKVLSKNQDVKNITQAYTETSITIQSLKTQEARLLEMMEEAKSIDEMLMIESRLTDVQNELAICQTNLNRMDTDVAYSTVSLSIKEVMEYTPQISTYTFGDRLKNSFRNSWDNISSFLEDALFFIIEDLPVLLMVLGVFAFVLFIIIKCAKKLFRKKNNSSAASSLSVNVPAKGENEE